MTSMRMRLLFSLSFVRVLVRYIGGERGGGGGGCGGDDVQANAVFSFFCSRAGAVQCGSSQKRPVQLDSPRTNAHLEANQTNRSCYHVQMTMLLILPMPRSFF